ncbi:MAG: PKD domain-containing protein [Gaiellaceae bacterium]
MSALKGHTRTARRWLRPQRLVLVVATVIAASLASTTNATPAAGGPVANRAHPVIDAGWIYAENWFDSTNFIYKVAGSDGCLPSATTCGTGTQTDPSNNLPENYNGAQEFYSWWKGLGTTSTPQPNGPLGKFMTARDHLFPTRTWQLNDAELTIPGATCAGQQVMLASHNDSTPVNNVANGAQSGSPTPMSSMHSGNWGNGSAYDANMGELMNLEELGSVLRWHEANHTYPARTIKATLYDNEEGGLVGSSAYSAAGTPAAILTAPSAAGDTNVKVTSTTNLPVGATVALDEVNTENPTVALVGTATTNTSLAAPAAAGDTKIYVASINGLAVGDNLSVDLGTVDTSSISAIGTAQRTATTLAAPAAAGDTNIKVASVTNMVVGEKVAVDVGFDNAEYRLITAVGTLGSAGTGVTLDAPLSGPHASGNPVQDVGSGVTLGSALSSPHRVTARVIDTSKLGTGITLTAPLANAHSYGSTVNGSATGLLSDSPQGRIIGVLNNDQDGLNYPAHKWGTGYYMSNLLDGQAGPWFNNINATPVSAAPNGVYGTVGIQRLQHNLPAVQAFRSSAADAVTKALEDLGQKYNFSIPLEGPLLFKNTGSVPDNPDIQSVPAYLPSDQALYTPVLDDRTGRTDQVSFGVRGIPSLGDIGQYDSSIDPLVGGADNPYPASYPNTPQGKPTLSGEFGQDSNSDYFSNLNFWASGTVHGPNGFDSPSEGLLRGVEFISTWFSYVIASPDEGGAVKKPDRPIAYFEMTPRKPTAQTTVTFDAGFSRNAGGKADGLTYYWDFGDGSPLTATTDPLIQHTFPTQAAWRDVKLLVGDGDDHWGSFRQLEPIDFFPTYYPALVPPTEPLAPTTGPAADPCGTLTPDEQSALVAAAATAGTSAAPTATTSDLASWALKPH